MTLNDEDIGRIAAGLIDASLPRAEWTHAAHLAAALWLLRHRSENAFATMPGFIQRYNEISGTLNTDTSGYHDTITRSSLRMVSWFISQREGAALSVILSDILTSPFGKPDWLLDYWSRDYLFSPAARRGWGEPDLRPLPFWVMDIDMSTWRPLQEIRVKVIGLVRRDEHFLVAEVRYDAGTLKGVRPLGGSVDFGERREDALHREFREELGTGIDIFGPWQVFENIFMHEDATGHEIVFAAAVRLRDESLYAREAILFREDNGVECRALWIPRTDFVSGRIRLFPDGLMATLYASGPE